MRREDFQDNAPGQLVQVEHEEGQYWAFVPDPLPPSLDWDMELIACLSDADRALGELAGVGRSMANPHLLLAPFLRREAVSSSRIEGTQADLLDLYAYEASQLALPGLSTGASKADIQETLNYVHAMEYGRKRIKELPVSLRLIQELHERLLTGVRGGRARPGEFRTIQNMIGGDRPHNARFVPPPVNLTPDTTGWHDTPMYKALSDLEKYLHEDSVHPPLVRLAFIHYQFETIHPFLDGNGRVGRLLISLLLTDWNLLPLPLLYLSAYFEEHRMEYYDHLLAVSQGAAWRDWVMFFLTGISRQASDASSRAKELNDLREHWRSLFYRPGKSNLPIRLVDYLFEMPVLTIPEASRYLEVTYRPARDAIDKLVEARVLTQINEAGQTKLFVAEAVLKALRGIT